MKSLLRILLILHIFTEIFPTLISNPNPNTTKPNPNPNPKLLATCDTFAYIPKFPEVSLSARYLNA